MNVPGSYVDSRLPSTCNLTTCNDTGLLLVAPGNPRDSLLYRRINPLNLSLPPFDTTVNQPGVGLVKITDKYTGPQEPRDSQGSLTDALDPAQIAAFRDWITQGALAN